MLIRKAEGKSLSEKYRNKNTNQKEKNIIKLIDHATFNSLH